MALPLDFHFLYKLFLVLILFFNSWSNPCFIFRFGTWKSDWFKTVIKSSSYFRYNDEIVSRYNDLVSRYNEIKKTCEIFSVKEWCDLENRVRVRSRSLEMAPFDRSHMSSYSPSIVTMAMAISCIVCESDLLVENRGILYPTCI